MVLDYLSLVVIPSVLVGSVIGAVVLWVLFFLRGFEVDDPCDWLDGFFLASVASLSGFIFLISALDFGLEVSRSRLVLIILQDLESGRLGLRVTSWLIGANALVNVFQFVRLERVLDLGDASDCPEVNRLSDRLLSPVFEQMVFSQYGIYVYAIFVLWISSLVGLEGVLMALLSWALFFVVDDWVVISGYVRVFRGRMLVAHRVRLVFFNVLISVLLFGVIVEWSLGVSVLVVSFMLTMAYRQYVVSGEAQVE